MSLDVLLVLPIFLFSGASEDIAKAFAEELARHGVNLILVGRDLSSVRDSSAWISETHGVESIMMEVDFSLGPEACSSIMEVVEERDVGFVVNCLDSSLHLLQNLQLLSENQLWNLINTSISTATLVTWLALPGMAQRRRGAVINISSRLRWAEGKVLLSAVTVRVLINPLEHLL